MTDLLVRPSDPELDLGEAEAKHIIKAEPGESPTATVLRARIEGIPLEALCGYIWIPHKNPDGLPLCQKCKEIFDLECAFNGLTGEPAE